MTYKNAAVRQILQNENARFEDLVIRRAGATKRIGGELTKKNGRPKYPDPNDNRIVFGSPVVDIAPTPELADETAEICLTILRLTHWQIRLLSKSPLITRIARGIPLEYQQRVIYGLSIGTGNDRLAAAIESGAPSVSKRVGALHWLQDNGFRTFGMLCPSLPQRDYDAFSAELCAMVRVDRCEHVWAEVLNARGPALARTCSALDAAGFHTDSDALRNVSKNSCNWEAYARSTFQAHARHIPAGKLRFLQYVSRSSRAWWTERIPCGAVVLGRELRRDRGTLAATPST